MAALAILVLLIGAVSAADRPEPVPQNPAALRGFSDRHDKFNQNYADPLDSVNSAQQAKKGRTAPQPQQPDEHADYYDSRAQVRQQRPPVNNRRHYDDYYRYDQYEYEGVNRNGESTYETNTYNANNANRKTLSLGGKSSNLALVVSPLAGISFIAVAAAVAISPVYLTLSSSLFGRKRRDVAADPALAENITPEMMQKIQELQTLEKFLASVPKEADYQQQIMSMYLSCSGYTEEGNVCLDRVFCEYGNAESKISEEERDVLSIVLYNIMSNEFVPAEYKQRLRTAARLGRDFQQCSRYDCPALSQ